MRATGCSSTLAGTVLLRSRGSLVGCRPPVLSTPPARLPERRHSGVVRPQLQSHRNQHQLQHQHHRQRQRQHGWRPYRSASADNLVAAAALSCSIGYLAQSSSDGSKPYSIEAHAAEVAPSPDTLMGYLVEAALDSGPAAQVLSGPTAYWIVTGNQACDTDSIVSAITTAYLIRKKLADDSEQVVPWLQCTAAELACRPEAVVLLAKAGIKRAALVFRGPRGRKGVVAFDVLPPIQLSSGGLVGLLKLTLVDHNQLPPGPQSYLKKSVMSIIDHHADTGSCEHVKGTDRVIAYGPAAGFPERRGVGSCATLVAEMYFNTAPELLKMDPSIGTLLLGAILIDTENLGDDRRTTDRDRSAVDQLYKLSARSFFSGSALPSREQLYQEMAEAKFDADRWRKIPAATLLEADFKAFLTPPLTFTYGRDPPKRGYGISSVLLSLDDVSDPADFVAAVQSRTEEMGLAVSLVMSFRPPKSPGLEPTRMLLLHCPKSVPRVSGLAGYLEGLHDILGLEKANCDLAQQSSDTLVYYQRNHATSRKVMVQILDAFFTVPADENKFVLAERSRAKQSS